jgi:hypothetical protein
MCFISMVMTDYGETMKKYQEHVAQHPDTYQWNVPQPPAEVAELRKLVEEFKEAVALAKRLDVIMKQPDCVDPEKAKLEARVAELEAKLKAIQETIGA